MSMNNTPTPETDAEVLRFNTVDSFDDRATIPADFARKLERERNEARAELQLQLNSIKEYDYHYGLHVAERDQLRKVCDELANAIKEHGKQPTENPVWTDSLSTALESYNSLPHVTAKKEKQL